MYIHNQSLLIICLFTSELTHQALSRVFVIQIEMCYQYSLLLSVLDKVGKGVTNLQDKNVGILTLFKNFKIIQCFKGTDKFSKESNLGLLYLFQRNLNFISIENDGISFQCNLSIHVSIILVHVKVLKFQNHLLK